MKLQDFDYELPKELIAQTPVTPRDHCRLLVWNRKKQEIKDDFFYNLPNYLKPGDVLVVNDSKVFPARLKGKKVLTGGQVEVFLLRHLKKNTWECLVGGKINPGMEIELPKKLIGKALGKLTENTWEIEFNFSKSKVEKLLEKIGEVPLPPYIKREDQNKDDKKNYQTIYANPKHSGSAAAPTAGLHFTDQLLKKIKKQGIKIIPVTLHVGLGTFAPIKESDVLQHRMHSEFFSVSSPNFQKINQAKKSGQRIIAVGTTAARVLESANKDHLQGFTNIFIYPGYQFKTVDSLITNFHLPKSTLLLLISALMGRENVLRAYHWAIAKKYRFFSYGDALFID